MKRKVYEVPIVPRLKLPPACLQNERSYFDVNQIDDALVELEVA